MTVSTLLLILCISLKITTTSCSKVPQGLRFPLGIRGLFTTKYFQRVSVRDSDNLVKPFMQVAIQTTRYYATLSKLLLSFFKRKITNHIQYGGQIFLSASLCFHKDRTISSQIYNLVLCLAYSL